MADESLLARVHDLSDLELAALLCLISREHCLISTPADVLESLVLELQLVAARTFGLTWAVVKCSPTTSIDDFTSSLFSQRDRIANVVIAKDLDQAPHVVQIQALELLRTRRIFTHSSVQVAPKQFVFLPVIASNSGGAAHVTQHLNDFLAMAHWHDPQHGFVNLEEAEEEKSGGALISEDDITSLREAARLVQVDIDVSRYQMNIVSFLRMHRAVAQGITPAATKHFQQLMRSLAPLHKLDYVTPALVDLAAKKIYLHRIQITAPEHERSMQWGSTLPGVTSLLEGVGPEDVIEQTLEMVTAPV